MRRTQAVVLIQRTIEHWDKFGVSYCRTDAPKLALDLVNAAWSSAPPVFEGAGSVPPHPLSIAVYALSMGMDMQRDDDRMQCTIGLALGSLLKEVPKHLNVLAMNPADAALVEQATSTFVKYGEGLPELGIAGL